MTVPAATAATDPGAPHFKREMSLFDAMMIVMGAMIGSGIFIVSADIARTVGSPGLLLIVWLVTGLVTVIGALSYGELAGMMPQAGGLYVYLREAYNPLIGFLYGWTTFLVIQTGTIAAICVAFAKFTGLLIPWFSEKHVLLAVLGLKITAAQLMAIACIIVLTALNMRGLRTGKMIQGVFTVTKTVALAGLILLGFVVGANAGAIKANLANFWKAAGPLCRTDGSPRRAALRLMILAASGAMVGSLFASDAWYTVTYIAGEVKNPKKNIPLSLVLGAGIVILLYFLANVAYVVTLPVHGSPEAADVIGRGIQFAQFDRVGTAAAEMIFGGPAAVIMAVMIAISTFGTAWQIGGPGLLRHGPGRAVLQGRGQAEPEVGPRDGPRRPGRLGQPALPERDLQRPARLRDLRRPHLLRPDRLGDLHPEEEAPGLGAPL
jgi:APA family basic amino acid/polyamine antiporter